MRHHLITGVLLLALLLGLGLLTTQHLSNSAGQAEEELQAAFRLSMEGDLESAHRHTKLARTQWKRTAPLASCLMQHQQIELINGLMHDLDIWYCLGEPQKYAYTCAQLSQQLQALQEGEKPFYYNLLLHICHF